MLRCCRRLTPLEDRGPMRVMFVITCMPVGGAETLLVELIRRLDRSRFLPELCCLKYPGPLGEVLAKEVPTHTGLLAQKYDFAVLWRLVRLLKRRRIDAVVTVGTGGDKMFWGRLAGWLSGVPVICSALHSTGLPDHVELPNRLLAPLTDAFIGVAEPHGRYLAEHEGCPADRVRVIPNGVDIERFRPRWPDPGLRVELGLPEESPVAGIVAALATGEESRTVPPVSIPRASGTPGLALRHHRRRAAAAEARSRSPRNYRWPTPFTFLAHAATSPRSCRCSTCSCSVRTWRPIRSRSSKRWPPRNRSSPPGSAPSRRRFWKARPVIWSRRAMPKSFPLASSSCSAIPTVPPQWAEPGAARLGPLVDRANGRGLSGSLGLDLPVQVPRFAQSGVRGRRSSAGTHRLLGTPARHECRG